MKNFPLNIFQKNPEFKGWGFYFDRHPVMTAFYSLLTITFGTLSAFVILDIILLLAGAVMGNSVSAPFSLPIVLNPKLIGTIQNHKALIESLTSSVTFLKAPLILVVFIHVYFLILLFSAAFFMFFFRKIIFSAIEDNPFDKDNIKWLRFVGLILIITPVILHILYAFDISLIINNNLLNTKFLKGVFTPYSNTIAEYLSFIFGAFTFLLAAVFKQGIRLREEQALTI